MCTSQCLPQSESCECISQCTPVGMPYSYGMSHTKWQIVLFALQRSNQDRHDYYTTRAVLACGCRHHRCQRSIEALHTCAAAACVTSRTQLARVTMLLLRVCLSARQPVPPSCAGQVSVHALARPCCWGLLHFHRPQLAPRAASRALLALQLH